MDELVMPTTSNPMRDNLAQINGGLTAQNKYLRERLADRRYVKPNYLVK